MIDATITAANYRMVSLALNILGVQVAATFELLMTLLAIFELLVFMGVVSPGFSAASGVKRQAQKLALR